MKLHYYTRSDLKVNGLITYYSEGVREMFQGVHEKKIS
jgi:hypothetical protein